LIHERLRARKSLIVPFAFARQRHGIDSRRAGSIDNRDQRALPGLEDFAAHVGRDDINLFINLALELVHVNFRAPAVLLGRMGAEEIPRPANGNCVMVRFGDSVPEPGIEEQAFDVERIRDRTAVAVRPGLR
jgi:hypothetical protein